MYYNRHYYYYHHRHIYRILKRITKSHAENCIDAKSVYKCHAPLPDCASRLKKHNIHTAIIIHVYYIKTTFRIRID